MYPGYFFVSQPFFASLSKFIEHMVVTTDSCGYYSRVDRLLKYLLNVNFRPHLSLFYPTLLLVVWASNFICYFYNALDVSSPIMELIW